MISTSRGLSAVRPGDDPDAVAARFWQGGLLRSVAVGEAMLAGEGGPGDAGQLAASARATGPLQLPVDEADGNDSTANTSALAV
jgi:hypothetical protein